MNKIYFLIAWYGFLVVGLGTLVFEGTASWGHITAVSIMMGVPTAIYFYKRDKQIKTKTV